MEQQAALLQHSGFPAYCKHTADESQCGPGLYQAGPKNIYFRPSALAGWLLNAVFHAALMFVMVIYATRAIYSDRSSGTTFSHWEVCLGSHSGKYAAAVHHLVPRRSVCNGSSCRAQEEGV